MDKLFKGIIEFRKNDYKNYRELFQKISNNQKPHTLFIGCSDSRIDPNLITNTLPGELFVVRNIANIVPYYHETEEFVSTTSAIEYAVQVLYVKNIVVCGHSNCGGCDALYQSDDLFQNIPHVKKWLELSKNVIKEAEKQITEDDNIKKRWITEQMNIIEQMKHLFTYPFIKEKYKKKQIKIYGWYYIIESGKIFGYDNKKNCFKLIN